MHYAGHVCLAYALMVPSFYCFLFLVSACSRLFSTLAAASNNRYAPMHCAFMQEAERAAAAAAAEEAAMQNVDAAAYRTALERTLGAPAAAHPTESYGDGNLSLAGARRKIAATVRCETDSLH